MTDLTHELIGAAAADRTRTARWFEIAPRRDSRRRTASVDTGATPLGIGPFQAITAIVVTMLALPVLALTLMGCAFAYLLRAVAGGGHG